jgi:hypothetical protein
MGLESHSAPNSYIVYYPEINSWRATPFVVFDESGPEGDDVTKVDQIPINLPVGVLEQETATVKERQDIANLLLHVIDPPDPELQADELQSSGDEWITDDENEFTRVKHVRFKNAVDATNQREMVDLSEPEREYAESEVVALPPVFVLPDAELRELEEAVVRDESLVDADAPGDGAIPEYDDFNESETDHNSASGLVQLPVIQQHLDLDATVTVPNSESGCVRQSTRNRLPSLKKIENMVQLWEARTKKEKAHLAASREAEKLNIERVCATVEDEISGSFNIRGSYYWFR